MTMRPIPSPRDEDEDERLCACGSVEDSSGSSRLKVGNVTVSTITVGNTVDAPDWWHDHPDYPDGVAECPRCAKRPVSYEFDRNVEQHGAPSVTTVTISWHPELSVKCQCGWAVHYDRDSALEHLTLLARTLRGMSEI